MAAQLDHESMNNYDDEQYKEWLKAEVIKLNAELTEAQNYIKKLECELAKFAQFGIKIQNHYGC